MSTKTAGALQLTLKICHRGCWITDITAQIDVGVLGYGLYTRDDGQATTHYSVYADRQAAIEHALTLIREHPSVYSVSEMTHGYRHTDAATPGNTTCNILVEHDGTGLISEAFTSRGFTYAAPADAYGNTERWTVLSNDNRDTIQSYLADIRNQEGAQITIESIVPANQSVKTESLSLGCLSHRQREVFQLARKHGYYRQPKRTTAGDLATKLDITTSTFHEHLHKAEEKLLNLQ